jgi:uncharacterized membrane protein (UPF0127 family)
VARKAAILIPVVVAAAAIGVLGISYVPSQVSSKEAIEFPKGTVRVNDDVITVEIAETAAQKERWLMFRNDKLPLDSAMLLKYDKPDLYSIWLLNIQYNLDLIWFSENGTAIYIIKNAPPCQTAFDPTTCTYKNTEPALYIMAATAGFVEKHRITEGSKMTIISV